MKALRKQFLAAIAMTLVAAIALGSSTYAWFATNNSAEASGMEVMASTEGGLLIGAYAYNTGTTTIKNPTVWKSAVPAGMDTSESLYPTSVAPFSTKSDTGKRNANTWYWAVSDNLAKHDEGVTTYKALTLSEDTENILKQYRLYNRFNLKTVEGTAADVYLKSVTVTGKATMSDSDKFSKSLRVAVEIEGVLYTFAPYYDTKTDTYTLKYVNSTSTTGTYGSDDWLYKNTGNRYEGPKFPVMHDVTSTGDSSGTNGKDVSVYIYYDGMDENCFSYQAIYGQGTKGSTARGTDWLKVAVELTTTEPNLW